MKKYLLALLFILTVALPLFAAEVKNIKPSQVGNRVLFEFDVDGSAGEETYVSISITINGKTYTSDNLYLEGDFGNVKAGRGKKIYWNVLQDFPRGLNSTFDVEINTGGKDSTTGMEFVFVKGGCFQMGDTFGGGDSDEKPVHEVCVDDFYIAKYEVTQGQWKAVMGNNPSYFKDCGDICPVEQVSWNDIQEFIKRLNQKTKNNPQAPFTKGEFRLPTEAEWEYAARSGRKNEKWAGTSNESELGDYAWYEKNSGSKTHQVGQKKPNDLGIYDMSGNVWEWCNDWYDKDYYKNSPKNNPTGLSIGTEKILRGGSWSFNTRFSLASYRSRREPTLRYYLLGFRLAVPVK